MPLDLPAARALHERCPHDPGNCKTCRDETWPCPTATALGATGHSEWDNDTAPSCTDAPSPDYIPCGNTEGKYRQQPCILAEKHWDYHVDRDGNRWGQEINA